ncbi:MAG TPA: hypothetical protein VHN98_02280 [Acidimicrobiales bacterium]|nr:hypothetical protein [Acidimicrobiales bacterium]
MGALVALETVVLVVMVVLVAGLLRSHARILGVLQSLGVDAATIESGAAPPGAPVPVAGPTRGGSRSPAGGLVDAALAPSRRGAAVDIVGTTPADETISISVTSPRVDTLLAFLSAGCSTCQGLWDQLRDGEGPDLPDRARLVVVTLSPGEESVSRLERIAPRDVLVVMSSDAWRDYAVPGAPYFIWVSGADRSVKGEGSARSWREVASLLRDAHGDARRAGGRGRAREHDVDSELAAAGILPGDPRLYHDRADSLGS